VTATSRRLNTALSLVTGSDLPEHEAARLLAVATGRDRASLARDGAISAAAASRFAALAERRRAGEPLQYLEGTSQFGPVDLIVDPRALIPRPETEQLWEVVTTRLATRPPSVAVDLGTGSGNLAIALKERFPGADVHATDISLEALDLARANAVANGAEIEFHDGDLFAALPAELAGKVDLIISNPPYIATGERADLAPDVRDHEPDVALFAGDDGLDVLRRILTESSAWLAPAGLLACEIAESQGDQVLALATTFAASIHLDLAGKERFLIAQKGAE